MSDFRGMRLAAMRAKIAAIESGGRSDAGVMAFGDDSLDGRLAGGGLPLGRWHEITGVGIEAETPVVEMMPNGTAICPVNMGSRSTISSRPTSFLPTEAS